MKFSALLFVVVAAVLGCTSAFAQDVDGGSVCAGDIPDVEELSVRPNLAGKWISSECETRPGAKFVLRSYEFQQNFSFTLDLHHYRDEWCSTPMFSARAMGAITDDSFIIFEVKTIPHNALVAREVQEKVNKACPGFSSRHWRANREYILQGGKHRSQNTNYHTSKRSRSNYFDCAHALNLQFGEFSKIRIQKIENKLELLLADIPQSGSTTKPKGYQLPLVKIYDGKVSTSEVIKSSSLTADNILLDLFEPALITPDPAGYGQDAFVHIMRSKKRNTSVYPSMDNKKLFKNCAICEIISRSSIASPPYLPTRPKLPVYLTGHWTSRRCESHPNGGYTIRQFEFREQNRKFHAKLRYFEDHRCENALYTLQLRGEYYLGMYNSLLRGSTDVDFYTHKTIITIHDEGLLEGVNNQLRGILDRRPKIQEFRQQFYAFQSIFARNVKYCDEELYELDVPIVHARTNCKIYGLENSFFAKNVLKLEVDMYGTTLLSMGKLGVTFANDIIHEVEQFRHPSFSSYSNVIDRASSYGMPLEHCENVEANLEQQFLGISSGSNLRLNAVLILLCAVIFLN
ncbi:protein APCDD1-like [Ctenocephalides felis]|uniref:protein APCDD1-like n=1 Tax=Ctenocephalides felis TaxID=7515 RepID=UPI000E6E2C02|nr:protein APCDD1-like [Ctenocephalides felis]